MDFENFAKIYPQLPHNVAIYYSDTKKKFNLSHEEAYKETLKYARSTGQAIAAELGKPAHESKIFRLLLRHEL